MKKRSEYPEKKDSYILKVILQVISFLLIFTYITLYFSTQQSISINISSFIHFLCVVILVAGFFISFENTLYAGLVFLFVCLIITIAVILKIFELTALVINVVIGVSILITGIFFIVAWFIGKSQWD